MLIKTQDRTTLVNMDRMAVIAIFEIFDGGNGAFGIFAYATEDMGYNDGCLLGRYVTMDDAKEVIGQIEHAYIAACNGPMVLRMPKYEEGDDV